MTDVAQTDKNAEARIASLREALRAGRNQHVWTMLSDLHPAEIAHILESLPSTERQFVWNMVDMKDEGDILLQVNDEVRAGLIKGMDNEELIAATDGMDMDDLADLLNDLPDMVIKEVLHSMDKQDRSRLESVLSYPEDSAGGLMNTDTITVRADVTLDVVLRYLRLRGDLPEFTDNLIVVNRFDMYLGSLALSRILTSDPSQTVAEVMDTEIKPISVNIPAHEVAHLFEKRDLISAAVVNEESRLLGRITIDDVVDVIRDEADHSLMSMAGLHEEDDIFAPVISSAKRRALWLGINLLTAFLAAWVIGLFQVTLEKVVALAVLMPIAASMGGIAGTQTLTLVIRGMALGHIGKSNSKWLLYKEAAVGSLNGVIWALIVAGIAILWFGDIMIGAFIAAAMLINLIIAALAGVTIPLVLRGMGIDPALAGSVILTTVTDVIGYLAFLGLATIYLI
ncbi:MAG: magnesium transporter [Gammaproteobacteria bacterium]|nr:magnesium transporter [Gammaproteobacteria bacterium]